MNGIIAPAESKKEVGGQAVFYKRFTRAAGDEAIQPAYGFSLS
jgi:hypothetical protein